MLTQQDFYAAKLAYEMDAADVWSALQAGERLLLIDARARGVSAGNHPRRVVRAAPEHG